MTFIGIGLIVLAAVTMALGFSRVKLDPSNSPFTIVSSAAGEPIEFAATAGDSYALIFDIGDTERINIDDVVVVGPDGTRIDLQLTTLTGDSARSGSTDARAATFTTPETGIHTVTLTGASASVPGTVAIIDASKLTELFGRVATGALIMIGSAVTGVVGLGLSIAGAIWWGVRSSARRRSLQAGPTVPTGPPTYGYYSP